MNRLEAIGADPQLLFAVPRHTPCVLTFIFDSIDTRINPQLFLDWGDGFHDSDKIDVGSVQTAILRLSITDPRGLRAIRVDPTDGPSVFLFRSMLSRRGDDSSWADRLVQDARARGRVAVLKDIAAEDYARPGQNRLIGMKRRPRTSHEHYLKILEMARVEYEAARSTQQASTPLFSLIVPTYNTSARYLDDLLDSFRIQPPGLAELVLSDDGSTSSTTLSWLRERQSEPGVVIVFCGENQGIAAATNEGIKHSKGAWIGFVDHDDALAPFALDIVDRAIQNKPDVKFVYTDEMIVDKRLRSVDYFLKPAFDPVLLSGMNYINHLSLYRRDRLLELNCLRSGFDGSQDYDLLLRYVANLTPSEALHVPYPAYLWRRDGKSYSVKQLSKATARARRALSEIYSEGERPVEVDEAIAPSLHRVRFDKDLRIQPKVSIVIPNKDSYDMMSRVLNGLFKETDYENFEVIVIDNGSQNPSVLELYERTAAKDPRFNFDLEILPFNFSRQVNKGMELATGELILLLNNDVEIVERNWLKEMVSCFQYQGAGIVGARLLYPDRTLQHAGVIVGLGGFAGHWFIGRPEDFSGPMARLNVRSTMTAVTGACMMISRECIDQVGLFDEQNFAVAYNDIDFCIRATKAGFRVIYTPFAKLIHHESASRGRDDRGKNRPRFLRDQASLLERHETEDFIDRAYSPWYSRNSSEPGMIVLDQLPDAR